jgi:hypothetical protein
VRDFLRETQQASRPEVLHTTRRTMRGIAIKLCPLFFDDIFDDNAAHLS